MERRHRRGKARALASQRFRTITSSIETLTRKRGLLETIMKSLRQGCWLAIIVCVTISGQAAELLQPKLTGIVRIGKKNRALLELTEQSPSRSSTTRKPILCEGERDGALEVTAIDEVTGVVKGRNSSEPLELRLDPAPEKELADRTLCLRSADLRQVLEIYQDFSGRTVISMVRVSQQFTLESGPALSVAEATAFLERALADKGITVKSSGTKFVFVGQAEQLDQLWAIPDPSALEPTEAVFGPGMIKFEDSDVRQVLDIYQDLTGRTILRPQGLNSREREWAKISVRSQNSMTRKEAIWLLDALLFSQAGLATFPEGDKFVFVVPSGRKGGPPKFKPEARAAKAGKTIAPGSLKFRDADIVQLVRLYAELSGREALPLSRVAATFSIRNQQPLSPEEAMFALEAVAALNNLRLEKVGDDKVQIVPSAAKSLNTR